MKTYNSIEHKPVFCGYSADNGYVRLDWKVTLKIGKRQMEIPYFTGLRRLTAPKGFGRWLIDGAGKFHPRTEEREALNEVYRNRNIEKEVINLLKAEFKVGGFRSILGRPAEKIEAVKKWVRAEPPTKQDVLNCMALEHQTVENCLGFEEYADNVGLSSDSREAERTYSAILQQSREFKTLCGGLLNMEDCFAFALAVDDYGHKEAVTMWTGKQEPPPGYFYGLYYEAREGAWNAILVKVLKLLQNEPLLGAEFVCSNGYAQFIPESGEPFDMSKNDWYTEEMEEFRKEFMRFRATFGAAPDVRLKVET